MKNLTFTKFFQIFISHFSNFQFVENPSPDALAEAGFLPTLPFGWL